MASRIITPGAYQRPEKVRRIPAMSTLSCESVPSGAEVTVTAEGISSFLGGITPVTITLKPNILYKVTFKKGGYQPVTKSFQLAAGEERHVKVTLTAEGETSLVCKSTPEGAEVTVTAEGISAYLGGTTPITLDLKPNVMYTLTFKKLGLEPVYRKYSLKPGEVRTINVTLAPPPEPLPPIIPPEPEPEPPELPKIDVISFTLPPECVIGDVCKGNIELKNNTDAPLEGTINIGMQGAVPVSPTGYSIPSQATETVVFEIPTVGLTITGTYVLELEMMVGTEVVETATGKLVILPLPEYEVTFNSEPATATVEVTELQIMT